MFYWKEKLSARFESIRQELYTSLLFTFLWGLAAHGYMFLNNSISHDSLDEFSFTAELTLARKYANGRVFWPIYREILQIDKVYPLLLGLLGLFYLGLAVYLMVRIFKVNSKITVFLMAGIMTVNIPVIATAATFMHDFDCDMLALLLSVTAVYFWKQNRYGWLLGTIPLMVVFGLYQGYITVAITLAMLVCILELLDGNSFKNVFLFGLKAIIMLIGAGILYFVAMKVILRLEGRSLSGSYNSPIMILSLTVPDILAQIVHTWTNTLNMLLHPHTVYSSSVMDWINGLFLLSTIGLIVRYVICKKVPLAETLLIAALVLLLPLGMNAVEVLAAGRSHELMYYAIYLIYPFALVVAERYSRGITLPPISEYPVKTLTSILMALILWSNIQLAHEAYLVKDFEQDAQLSFFTRVTYRIENHEDYVTGETPIAFVGYPEHLLTLMPDTNDIYSISGMYYPYPWYCGTAEKYEYYYRYVLLNPAVIAPYHIAQSLSENPEVVSLSAYPAEDCMKIIDGILVVKLGN